MPLEPPACQELVIGAALDSDLGGACIDFAIELEVTGRPPDFDALRLGSGVGMRTEIGAGGITGDGGEKERIYGNDGD